MINNEQFDRPALRVIMLTPGLSPGGAERWMATLYEHRRTVSYSAVVCAAPSGNELAHHFSCARYFANGDHADIVAKMDEAVKIGVDLIVYWGLEAIWELHKYGVPLLQVSHCSGSDDEETNPGHKEFIKAISNTGANYLAGVCKSALEIFSKEHVTLANAKVIHNGIEIERVVPGLGGMELRKHWGIPMEAKVALYVGRFDEGKQAHELVKAMHVLPEEWCLVLFGWGKERDRYISLAPTNRVWLPRPRLNCLGDIYDLADVVVLPSRSEAFPLTIIEAWHCGKPLVCSEFDTLFEIEHQYNSGNPMAVHIGLRATPTEIARAIEQAITDQEMASRAQQISLSEFSAAKMVAKWESYFHHIVSHWRHIGQFGLPYRVSDEDAGDWKIR